MGDVLQHLIQTDVFCDLPEDALESISKMAGLISMRRGEYVFCEGEIAESFYIAISGFYRLIQHGENGQEIVVEVFGKGDPIGLVAVLRGGTYPSSVEVLENGQLLKFAVHDIEAILDKYPSVTKRVLIVVHQRLCESHRQMSALCTALVEQRLAASLMRLIRKVGEIEKNGSIQLDLRLRRRDLAQLSGTTVETVSRVLKIWEHNTIIETGRERVDVVDLKQLKSIAEGKLTLY